MQDGRSVSNDFSTYVIAQTYYSHGLFQILVAAPARLSTRNATTTAVTSAAGRCVHGSLNLVDPPGLFRWFVHCPGLMRRNAASTGSSSPSPPMLFYSSRPRHRLLRLPRLAPCSLALPVVPPIPASAVRLSNQTAVHSPHVALSTMCRMLFVFLQVHQ